MLMLGRKSAQAQAQQAITVIVSDFVDVRTKTTDALAIQARDAVYNELAASGQGRFNPVPEKEVRTEARQLGIRVPSNPSQPANFSQTDLIRLAKALNAEGIVTGRINVATNKKGAATTVAVDSTITDVASNDPINGAVSRLTIAARPGEALEEATTRTVGDSALDLVRQMVQRQLVTATVLNVNVETIILNRGTRDGLHVGDELVVLEYQTNGSTISKGRIKVARAYATDVECEAVLNNGIRPENIARALYRPNLILDINNNTSDNARSTRINFSGIGRTLSVIGLGVLLAVAIRGGQQAQTNVTAEGSSDGTSPTVRIRFQDNIFSQAGILQYKIYRNPDFPYSSGGGGGTTTGGGTGGTTGGNTGVLAGGFPVGTAPSTQREFVDRGSPNRFFANGATVLSGTSNGGNNTGGISTGGTTGGNGGTGGTGGGTTGGGGGTTGGGGSGNTGCIVTLVGAIDTGFTPGRSYSYDVTAVLLRQIVTNTAASTGGGTGGLGGGGAGGSQGTGSGSTGSTGGSTNGGGGSTGGTTGGGTGGGTSGSNQCIETDPARSGLATPITPVLITSPTNASTTVDLRSFNPSFGSRAGADLFQLEVSTDRSFSNPNNIYRQQLISTSPNIDNSAQNVSTPINLTQATQLQNNSTFKNFIGSTNSTTTPALPTLYFRVGARHDEDTPGPIAANDPNNPGQKDRTFRYVYSQVVSFTPVPLPPANPGGGNSTTGSTSGTTASAKAILNKAARAQSAIATNRRAVKSLNSAPRSITSHATSALDILSGRGRLNRN